MKSIAKDVFVTFFSTLFAASSVWLFSAGAFGQAISAAIAVMLISLISFGINNNTLDGEKVKKTIYRRVGKAFFGLFIFILIPVFVGVISINFQDGEATLKTGIDIMRDQTDHPLLDMIFAGGIAIFITLGRAIAAGLAAFSVILSIFLMRSFLKRRGSLILESIGEVLKKYKKH